MEKFNLLNELRHKAINSKPFAVLLQFVETRSDEAKARASSLWGKQFNAGMLIEALFNPNTRQNAQKKGEPSHGDICIEWNGKRLPCEMKALSRKSSADIARNGTTAPLTLLIFYDNSKVFGRLGKSSEVHEGIKGSKKVIKFGDNLDFGEVVNLDTLRTFAL